MANGVVRVEKKRVSYVGLIIVFSILVSAFCFGLYLYIQNPQKVKAFFKKDEVYIEEKTDSKGNVIVGNNALLPVDFEHKKIFDNRGLVIYIESVERANNGYTVTVLFTSSDRLSYADIKVNDVLIDGYSIDTSFKASIREPSEEVTTSFFIKKQTMAELEMTRFTKISMFFHIDFSEDKTKGEDFFGTAESFTYEKIDNRKKGLITVANKDNLIIYYYKLLQDKEFYYLYFILKGNNFNHNHYLQLKKLLINEEVYNYENNFEIYIRNNSMKQFYLKIPRKDFESIKNFRASFYIITDEGEDYNSRVVYITNANLIRVKEESY
ncbi:MAG: hypothetical protein IKQ29_02460 [Bacilli bacterium]|nr:hypothetical protein [Bacilli bacterium]